MNYGPGCGRRSVRSAVPDEMSFVENLPKTRSGKIMRWVIKAKALCEPVGDISTLANPEAVEN